MTFVFDKPLIKTQIFEVQLDGEKGRYIVERKEVIRQLHNMGCTDDLPDDYVDSEVSYKVTKQVTSEDEQKCIELVEKELEKVGG